MKWKAVKFGPDRVYQTELDRENGLLVHKILNRDF
jgi:hypothetical protein